MLTRLAPDLPVGSIPVLPSRATTLQGRVEQLEAELKTQGDEHRRLMAAIVTYSDQLNRDGALEIADAVINGSPIGNLAPSTGKFTALEVTTSSVFPRSSTTPVPTSGSGTFTTVAGAVRGSSVDDRFHFTVTVTITTNGTAATDVRVAMPFSAAENTGFGGATAAGIGLAAVVTTGGLLHILKYDGTYPGASGAVLRVSGSYRKA